MKLSIAEVRELGAAIALMHPEGIGGTAIAREIIAAHPEMKTDDDKPNGTVRGGTWNLDEHFPDKITKIAGKFLPKACDVTGDEENAVIAAYQEAQARIRHRRIDETEALRDGARAIVPSLRRIAANINAARSESGAAEQLGHIGIGGSPGFASRYISRSERRRLTPQIIRWISSYHGPAKKGQHDTPRFEASSGRAAFRSSDRESSADGDPPRYLAGR